MVQYLINRFLKSNQPIIVTGRNNANDFVQWVQFYTSLTSSDMVNSGLISSYPDIILYFPKTPVKISSYSMRTVKDDVYPTKWQLSGSIDKNNWEPLSSIKRSLCNDSYKPIDNHNKLYCKKFEVNTFQISNPKDIYYYYLKFQLLENSYYKDDPWKYALKTSGFEISGDYLIPFSQLTYCIYKFNSKFIYSLSLILLCIQK